MSSSVVQKRIADVSIELERDVFLRSLIRELAGTLQDVVGLEEASGFASALSANGSETRSMQTTNGAWRFRI